MGYSDVVGREGTVGYSVVIRRDGGGAGYSVVVGREVGRGGYSAVDVREEEWWDFHEGMSDWSPTLCGSVADQSSTGVHSCASYVSVSPLVENFGGRRCV